MVERSRSLLPAWILDTRRNRLTWVLWGLVFAAFSIMSLIRPGMREVLHVYRGASDAWLAGRPMYPGIDYPPPFVILFAPFARLSVPACEVLWRAVVMSIYVSSVWRLSGTVARGPRTLFFFVSVLSMQAAFGSIKSGQTNLLLAGAMAHATVDWIQARRRGVVLWLIIALVAKPISIVLVLLVVAADFTLIPWIGCSIALVAAIPLVFDSWKAVVQQYRDWWQDILSVAASGEHRFDDLAGLLRSLDVHVSPILMMGVRVAAAALTLGVWLAASRRFHQPRQGLMLLGLSAGYLMLFNPRTESNSYVMLSHAIAAFAALLLVVEGRRLGWLLVGLDLGMGNGSLGRAVWSMTKLWLMPIIATIFVAFLVTEVWRQFRTGTDSAPSKHTP